MAISISISHKNRYRIRKARMRLSLRIRTGCVSLFSYDCGFRTVRSALDCAGGHAFDDVALQEQVQDEDRQHGQQ